MAYLGGELRVVAPVLEGDTLTVEVEVARTLPALLLVLAWVLAAAVSLRYLRSEIPPERYRRVDLPVADTIWEKIPEPDPHVFRAPANRPPVTLYREVGGR